MELGSKRNQQYQFGRLEAENEQLKLQVADKSKTIEELQVQIKGLQEGILAIQAPDSYQNLKDMEYSTEFDSKYGDQLKDRAAEANVLQDLAQELEKPLFKDADDLLMMFTKAQGVDEPESLHDNDES